MNGLDQLTARRAIESLRNGVPSAAAVRALGWGDDAHLDRFDDLLGRAERSGDHEAGLLVKGDFGTGKSHLLTYLQQRALERNFVVSRVVVSKETPLFNPDRVFAAAMRDGKVPRRVGAILHELAPGIDFTNSGSGQLREWASGAPGLLAASIYLMERMVELGDDELVAKVIDWWSGEKLAVGDVRAGLKKLGARDRFTIKAIRQADLPPYRIALTSQIIRAAGFAGWVILLDELELIGKYSPLQRAKSYGQLARWLGGRGGLGRSVVAIGAITSDFSEAVLDNSHGRGDRDRLPAMLRHRGADEAADDAQAGMDLIDNSNALRLYGPDSSLLRHTHECVRAVYHRAFDWEPPADTPTTVAQTTPMRTYIKTWIYGWDLVRLGVTDQPSIRSEVLLQGYEEDRVLEEGASEPDGQYLRPVTSSG